MSGAICAERLLSPAAEQWLFQEENDVHRRNCAPGAAAVLAALLVLSTVARAEDNDLRVFYDNGLHLETEDTDVALKFGGRIQLDAATFSRGGIPAPLDAFDDGTEFRRARLYFSGTIHDNVEFKAQYEFAGGDADFKDVWLGLKDLPVINHLRFGHQKEPFSLEELTSSKYITFMERALPNLFAPGRNTGVATFNTASHGRLWWGGGVFTETDSFGNNTDLDGGPNITGRISGLPLYRGDGAELLHVGLSVTDKGIPGGRIDLAGRPEAHLASKFLSTGDILADSLNVYDAEIAYVRDRFSAQGEFMIADLDAPAGADPSFSGGYAYVSFFLTHDRRAYKKSSAAFDRVKPAENFGKGGKGAWEIAVRYSMADLSDTGVLGGELDDLTFGVNWYLNPNTRFMLNYVMADLERRGDGMGGIIETDDFDAVMARWQIDF
ncbi:MAG: OprO/OprP family phosphate-selective porin [Acidobacteriota bacterium]